MQTLVLAVFLFMSAIGNGMGSVLFATVFRKLSTIVIMVTCAVCMLLNLAFFSRVARRWKPYRESENYHQAKNNEDGEAVELNEFETIGVIT